MNYTSLKANTFPYFRRAVDDAGNETFFPITRSLPNGMHEYHIVLKQDNKEYEILAITRSAKDKKVVVHTTTGMFEFPPRADFRINVYKTGLFVSG